MEFSVTIISRSSVRPSGPTPSGALELSAIDRLPVLHRNVQTLHVYKHGPKAAKSIREALSKALVPYYPLAGRLRLSEQNELMVDCSGKGAWFVEASADCTLDSVGYFDDVMSVPCDKLLPEPPREVEEGLDPLVQVQVTQFVCGGFVVGLTFCHSMCDGLGAAQFLNAVGEMARGDEKPSIEPAWGRDFLRPSRVRLLPSRNVPDYRLEQATIDLPLEKIKELKREFGKWAMGEKWCSTFEMVAAVVWWGRARAIGLPLGKLVFFANCRQLIRDPPLPRGFYGNCFFPVSVMLTNNDVEEEGEKGWSEVFRVVKLIQEAKAGLGDEFGKWLMNKRNEEEAEEEEDPFVPPLEYNTLFMSEWDRLGFKEVDYGWGKPVHIVPVQGSSIMPAGIILSPPTPASGVRLMTWCVEQTHLQQLLQNINTL